MIKDKDIRFKFILENKDLFKKGIFINEYVINGKSRVDFALLHKGEFYGFEIKSEADNTLRLISQLRTYLRFFDYIYLIVHEKHEEEVVSLLNRFKLDRIGLIRVDSNISFKQIRKSVSENKITRTRGLLRNLKKEDLIDLCKDKKVKISEGKEDLINNLSGRLSLNDIVSKLMNRLIKSYIKKCINCKSNLMYRTKNKDGKIIDKCIECEHEHVLYYN